MVELGKVNWQDVDHWRLLLLTSLSVSIETGSVYPLWLIKTRQQHAQSPMTMRQTLAVLRQNKVSLYRGYGTYVCTALPSYGGYILAYTWARSALGFSSGYKENEQQSLATEAFVPVVAGLFADMLSLSVYVPVEVVVQRVQASDEKVSSRNIVRDIWKTQGITGLYKGFAATLVTSGIGSAVWWLAYENLKKIFQKEFEARVDASGVLVGSLPQLLAGSVSSLVSAICSNPFDVAKTRVQLSGSPEVTFRRVLKDVVMKEGLSGMTRGIVPKMLYVAPLGALSSFTYEFVLWLSIKNKQE